MLQAFTFRYTCNIVTITKPVTKLNNQNVEGVNNDIYLGNGIDNDIYERDSSILHKLSYQVDLSCFTII